MSEFKTLAYDLYKIHGGTRPIALENLSTAVPVSAPLVQIYREQFIRWADNYKVLTEFAIEVLQKPDFTTWDLVDWYRRRARELETKADKVREGI